MRAQQIFEHILSLKTREERREALDRVPEPYRDFIKLLVTMEFKRNARERKGAQERALARRLGEV